MDSSTLLIAYGVGAGIGAACMMTGFYFGYRAGRQAAITHDGIRQAREVRDRILAGVLADGAVTEYRIADGAVTQNRIADGAIKPN